MYQCQTILCRPRYKISTDVERAQDGFHLEYRVSVVLCSDFFYSYASHQKPTCDNCKSRTEDGLAERMNAFRLEGRASFFCQHQYFCAVTKRWFIDLGKSIILSIRKMAEFHLTFALMTFLKHWKVFRTFLNHIFILV